MASNKIGNFTEQLIKLSDLELDKLNPRTGEHPDQTSAINAMLSRKSTAIDEMAEGIVRNGFLTLEVPCVYPGKNGKFVVAEGNRRITALKILKTPELARGSKKYSRFKQLSQQIKGKVPEKIKCAVFKNEKDCLPYVLMRHGLGNDGSSLKMWDALERRKMEAHIHGRPNQALKVIDFVRDNGDLSSAHEQQLADIKITNLERLTDSSSVRSLLGVHKADCTTSTHGADWIVKVWQRVIEVLLDEEFQGEAFNVKQIYTAGDQESFMHRILFEVHKIPMPKSDGEDDDTSGDDADSSGKDGKGGKGATKPAKKKAAKKSAPTTRQRKGLIAKSFSPAKLSPQKLINLVDELKSLQANKYANCSGVMFRVMMELSIYHYMKAHKISNKNPTTRQEISEKEKRSAVLKHLKANSGYPAATFKALEDTLNDNHIVSAQSLNYYVHSKTHSPKGEALKVEWDNLQHIFEIMWEA